MKIRHNRRLLAAGIPTATMADIAFLLIIFFMVTTAYTLDHTPMELPATELQQQAAKGAAVIAITRHGELRFSAGEADTRPVEGIEGLAGEIRSVTAVDSRHPFLIKADRNTPYQVIDQVLDELRRAHARSVTLLSRQEGRP